MGHVVKLLMISGLCTFFGLAVWEDCRKQRISNSLICIALLGVVLFQFRQNGVQGVYHSFFHAIIIILILFPLYLIRALGAGDLKLLGVTAILLSWRPTLTAFILGLYLALLPAAASLLAGGGRKSRIPMSGPILGGILIVLYMEGCG